jgi:ADP-heptose:LPS heptosyltransferase
VQLRRLGDVLMTTPSIRALREAFPAATIDFLTERPSQQLLEHNPHINNVIAVPAKRSLRNNIEIVKKLRNAKYDLAIDFNGLPSSAWLSWLSGAPKRLGINHRGRGLLYTSRMPFSQSPYSAQNKLDMLQSLGIVSQNHKLDFFTSASDKDWAAQTLHSLGVQDTDFLVTVSPVSRQPYKVWPAKNFAIVADHIAQKYNAKILFVFGPGEEKFVQDVLEHMTTKPLPTNYPMPSLAQTKALFERANLHIGNDNGPAHFAIAAGTAVITVFGEPRSENWSPPNNPRVKALEHFLDCKNHCSYPSCQLECLTGTTAMAVCHTADTLLATENLLP